jgi:N-carbamoylputrescine amidase
MLKTSASIGLVLACGLMIACAEDVPNYRSGGTVRVAAVQLTPLSGGLVPNLDNVERLIREAASRGAKYILLPEYFPGQMEVAPEMSVEEARAGAQTLDGPIARRLLALGRELDVYVGFPLGEKGDDGHVYNSTVYAGPTGISGVYRKRVLIRVADDTVPQEQEIYTSGRSNGVIDWGGIRIGALICADGGFENTYKARVDEGIQLFTHAADSWGSESRKLTPAVVAANYKRPIIFANKFRPGGLHLGNSRIVDASGTLLAHVGPEPNAVIDAQLEIPAL